MGHSRGFTLVELMITIAILAIVVGIAAPSFSSLIERNRLTSTTNQLLGFLTEARVEAIKRSAVVRVEQATTGTWSGGVLAWIDENGNGSKDADEEFLYSAELPSSFTLSLSGGTDIGFRPTGLSRATTTLTLQLCPGAGKPGRGIEIPTGGRVRSTEITCS